MLIKNPLTVIKGSGGIPWNIRASAIVTVTDENGEIKSQTTEHTVVFDIPKMLWQNSLNTQTSATVGYPTSYLGIEKYFKDICVNDKEISTTDPFNVIVPILTGSDAAPNPGIGTHTQYNASASSIVGNQMIRRWDWPAIAQAMSVKSISLGYAGKTGFSKQTRLLPLTKLLPNGYFLKDSSQFGASLYKCKSNVDFSSGKFDSELVVKDIVNDPLGDGTYTYVCLYQLKNNEFAFLSNSADITTPTKGASYLHIITFETTGIVSSRHWALTEFGAGFTDLTYYMCCATINGKNYICINKDSTNYGIFEIPDTQTAPSAGLTGTEYVTTNSRFGIGAISDSFLFKSNNYCKAFIINADSVTIKDKCFNYYNSSYGYDFTGGIDSLRGATEGTYDIPNLVSRVNTTALNFATPISVAQGDTLSITYTITAN